MEAIKELFGEKRCQMGSFDFLVTAICFSLLGYGLCYLTFKGAAFREEEQPEAKEINSP